MSELPKSVLQRLKSQQIAQEHPDPDLLSAFAENTLRGDERERMLAHLALCEQCRDIVALSRPDEQAQPAAVLLPWYRRPQTFAWSAVAATLVVGSALILNYREGTHQYAPTQGYVERTDAARPAATAEGAAATKTDNAATQAAPAPAANDKIALLEPKQIENQNALKQSENQKKMMRQGSGGGIGGQVPSKNVEKNAIAGGAASSNYVVIAPPTEKADSINKDIREERDQASAMKTAPAAAAPPPAPSANIATTGARTTAQAETVEVQSEAPAVGGVAPSRHASLDSAMAKARPAAKPAVASSAIRWTVSNDGQLQRSTDSGRTWQTAPTFPAKDVVIRTVATVGNYVWVGGASAALFHSSDNGQTWTRQTLPGTTGTVIYLRFIDAQHGTARCDDGTAWSTADGGLHWSKS